MVPFSTVVATRLFLVVASVLDVDNASNDFIVRQYLIVRFIVITFEPVLNVFLVVFFKYRFSPDTSEFEFGDWNPQCSTVLTNATSQIDNLWSMFLSPELNNLSNFGLNPSKGSLPIGIYKNTLTQNRSKTDGWNSVCSLDTQILDLHGICTRREEVQNAY
ncbi:hypothetical protein AVEN_3897-1 [Araneus ventricosus]|uniref:G-protein coupled receptors family 1 profile domain-containing protein n=1 Tax=Araneus ventricosus TaxID=182803 RepID=A0A4Y2J735_ARAVE|nr:hypothetical protein AVEN_3897-1 [Araneus ventricosus]